MIDKVDQRGRITIPAAVMQALAIKAKDEIEIRLSSDKMILKRVIRSCVFCNATENLVKIGDAHVCRSCIDRLHNTKDDDVLYSVKTDSD